MKAALSDANVHVFVIRVDGHIVATGTLCIKHTLEFTIADIESVVVSSRCRGRGYGKELSHYAKIAGISGIGKNKAPVTVLNNLFLLISKSLQTLQRFAGGLEAS